MLILYCTTLLILLIYDILIYYYAMWWGKLPVMTSKGITKDWPPTRVTVIIPARNEENNISACLQSLAEQTYPASLLQIIVVNDHSTDNTAQIVKEFPASNVVLINLADYVTDPINSYKKKAIEVAIAQASGSLIVTTDADCTAPPKWIETMTALYNFGRKIVFVIAPVKLVASPKRKERSLLFVFQALDFLALQGITAGAAYKRFHSMCNGANLAYEKKAFNEVGGFDGIDGIASGDDMLLMHKIFRKYPEGTIYVKSPDAIVSTQAANSWKTFLQQRIRWASKADKYEDKRIGLVLLLVYALNVLLLLLFIGSIIYHQWLIDALLLLVNKTIIEMLFMLPVARFFGRKRLMIWFPFMQPLHIIYTVVAGFFGKFGSYSWKGRKVR